MLARRVSSDSLIPRELIREEEEGMKIGPGFRTPRPFLLALRDLGLGGVLLTLFFLTYYFLTIARA